MDLYFITGTSSGLGYALTQEVLQANNRVVGIGRNHPHQAENYYPVESDLSHANAAASIELSDPWGDYAYERVVLVNNAGMIDPVKRMGHTDAADIQAHYQLNLVAPTVLANQLLAAWEKANVELVILNVSSGAAQRPIDGWACYCSAKSGLSMLSEVIDTENQLHKRNCRVYALAPGVVDTPMQGTIRSADPAEFSHVGRFRSLKESGELKSPYEVARNFITAVNGEFPNLSIVDRLN